MADVSTRRTRLSDLEQRDAFVQRHVGTSADDRARQLAELGLTTIDELLARAIPRTIRETTPLALGPSVPEHEALALLRTMLAANVARTPLIGLGYHGTITPPVIQRSLIEDPAWYTAYTPYQPEISQGRLEALLAFQTMVADLTGMDVANASLLDEATAVAEAMTMLRRATDHRGTAFFVDADCHPQTAAVVAARAEPLGIDLVVGDPRTDLDAEACFGAVLAYPGSSGAVVDPSPVIERVHAAGGLVAVTADPLALVLLTPPGELGADVVVGSTQRFGVPLWFGGPHAAYLATRDRLVRSLPGRLVGVSTDAEGRAAYRLALQTREQHIRRERATSNICTAQVLLAVVAAMYAAYHGPEGLRLIASRVHRLTAVLAAGLREAGAEVVHDAFFDTLTVRVPGRAAGVLAAARRQGLDLRSVDDDTVGITLDETSDRAVLLRVLAAFGAGPGAAPVDDLDRVAPDALPTELLRTSPILTHPVFHQHRSETAMMRLLRRLSDRDLALDRTMIPLGSCTMKLNPAAALAPVTWPEITGQHPFAPLDTAAGTLRLIRELEAMLVEITGYDAVSLQPNAGSQGELAGLLAIRGYHRSRGDLDRDVCLIPSSAHGTNAASAVMAGMRVVVVACDEQGNVDLADLRARADQHADRLAAAMVTYPSTHGVYEEGITTLCEVVHGHGGQVYVDGANLNALVGVARPGRFGADVSHLNLHKTFCIPHGGGGPGVGPVGVRSHLAPFLPNHPLVPEAGPATGVGPIAAAPWGSAGILAISWMYITMMGSDGLHVATEAAVLSANYLAARLGPHYPVLYRGEHGLVAHELILDLRPLTRATGVTVDDVAKRLMDYGFHAPTVSFPVSGTLMVEPTESESLAELDRFVDAMVAIRREIDRVAAGDWPLEDSPLRRAPHTVTAVAGDDWDRPYRRDEAAFPLPWLRADKYWPPVARIDAAWGDRHLTCSCPPIEELAES
ncbi:MAG: aminomethyl-transferring glycine dehydrogenase [Acidimicrobiales bacterium]|nr:aminomethyl-transferring glycine dehydrogenase [Acidimicrobiales bacterium]